MLNYLIFTYSTIKKVYIVSDGANFLSIITFEDKISSVNLDFNNQKLYVGFDNGIIKETNVQFNYLINSYRASTYGGEFIGFFYSEN